MHHNWERNILANLELVKQNTGSSLVTIVSGNEADRMFWYERFSKTRHDIFRSDGNTQIVSLYEGTRKGNFLGTFNAWREIKQRYEGKGNSSSDVSLMIMVFGQGKRFSPFTQALGNRKPGFVTPMLATKANTFLRTAELSSLYTNLWIHHLQVSGFGGLVVKWGDEAIIPSDRWAPGQHDFSNVDAIRFIWKTDITEDLAREKDWVLIDARTGLMKFQYSRQDLSTLKARISALEHADYEFGVNLGSLAVTYQFLETALEILHDDILNNAQWADWDPYVWIALSCHDESQWQTERDNENKLGKAGIKELEAHYPDFYPKMAQLRSALEAKTGRPFTIGVLDFGDAFWVDAGLHVTLRNMLESTVHDSVVGRTTRALLGIPHEKDRNGNIIVRSRVPEHAAVHSSIIIDTEIQHKESRILNSVIVGGQHGRLYMPYGGSALFCAADEIEFSGPHGVAFRSVGQKIVVPEGGRHTTLFVDHEPLDMVSNESVRDYNGENYTKPILGNRLSFQELAEIVASMKNQNDLELSWLEAWQNRRKKR